MTRTGQTDMTYNASSQRFKTKEYNNFTQNIVHDLNVKLDGAGLFYSNPAGPVLTTPHSAYTKFFTNSAGDFYPTSLRTGKSFKTGTKWSAINEGTTLQYDGETVDCNFFANIVLRPNSSDNRITGIAVSGGGNGYSSTPTVTITDGTGTGAVTTVILDGDAVDSIRIDNGGANYSGSVSANITGNASLGSISLAKITQVSIAIYKNGSQLNNQAVSGVIGDPNNTFTSNTQIKIVDKIKKGDQYELRIKNNSTSDHSYHIYQAVLNISPIYV